MLIVALLAVLGAAGVVLFGVMRRSDVDEKTATLPPVGTVTNADAEVELQTCVVDEAGDPVASGTLTNVAGEASNYLVSVSFRHDESQFDLVVEPVENVVPGEQAKWTATSFADFDGDFTCGIDRVERAATTAASR